MPVESDAVSELLDEEEAGVPSAKPKLNGKKSKGGFYTIFYRKKMKNREKLTRKILKKHLKPIEVTEEG